MALPLPSEEAILAELQQEEKAWQRFYLANLDKFRGMAQEALQSQEAGETLEMVIENGKISPR